MSEENEGDKGVFEQEDKRYLTKKQSGCLIGVSVAVIFIANFLVVFLVYYFYPKSYDKK